MQGACKVKVFLIPTTPSASTMAPPKRNGRFEIIDLSAKVDGKIDEVKELLQSVYNAQSQIEYPCDHKIVCSWREAGGHRKLWWSSWMHLWLMNGQIIISWSLGQHREVGKMA
jgi:hypothetical protein